MVASRSPAGLVRSSRRLAVLSIALACLAVLGCVAPMSSGLADNETDRSVEAAAADNSFPSAAEVGLSDDNQPVEKQADEKQPADANPDAAQP
jgi:hypothetical protein